MRGTVVFLILLVAAHLWFVWWSMWRAGHLEHLGVFSGLGAVVYGLGFLGKAAASLRRRGGSSPGEPPINEVSLPVARPRISLVIAAIAGGASLGAAAYLISVSKVLPELACYVIGFGVGLAGIGFLVARAIRPKLKDERPCLPVSTQRGPAARFMSGKVILVVAATLLAELLVVVCSTVLMSAIALEALYYGVLLVSGAVLGAWCKSAKHVPILAAVLVLLLVSGTAVLMLLASPRARFMYGPEISIFAMEGHLARMTMLPLDIAVMLSSWRVAVALSCRRTR